MSQKKFSIQQVLEFSDGYEKSHLTIADFGTKQGLSYHTACWLRMRALKYLGSNTGIKKNNTETVKFSEVIESQVLKSGIHLEIADVKVCLEDSFSSSMLRRVVGALRVVDV